MIIKENDIRNFENYIEINVLEKFGIRILGTKKSMVVLNRRKLMIS